MSVVSAEPRPIPTFPDLAGKVALVTGGSKGIGARDLPLLAANGVRVAVNARSQAGDRRARRRAARPRARRPSAISADVAELEQIERMREPVEAELGPVDILLPVRRRLRRLHARAGDHPTTSGTR